MSESNSANQEIDFELIEEWAKKYFKKTYKKGDSETSQKGQKVIGAFNTLADKVVSKFSSYELHSCSSWQHSGHIYPYLWVEFQKISLKGNPYSISMVVKNFTDVGVLLYLETEIDDKEIRKQPDVYYKNFLKTLEIPLEKENISCYWENDKEDDNYKKFTNREEARNSVVNGFSKKIRTIIPIKPPYLKEQSSRIINELQIGFEKLIPCYENIFNSALKAGENTMKNIPLNQILYGPPGTGKTYNTVIKAMEILNNEMYQEYEKLELSQKQDFYKNTLLPAFNRIKNEEKRIEFVTFHQSYSYEEFVEGIKPYISEWGNTDNEEVRYIGENGIFKQICKNASKKLYTLKSNEDVKEISFEDVYNIFQVKYPEGSDCCNLLNLSYEDSDNLIYHFGSQLQGRKIALLKIKKLFTANKQYKNAIDFNLKYDGNAALKGYHHTFYKELMAIKNAVEEQNQISRETDSEYIVNPNAPKYVLIIDEINRGDVSKIFGELITLIEEDKRIGNAHQLEVKLPYSKEPFGVPKNVYLIGTMNTADRSIALLDTALRRRFDFEEMMPNPELLAGKVVEGINLQTLLEKINQRITAKYDRDHQIGHSYFMGVEIKEDLERAYKNRILPLLNEYFYNESKTVAEILNCTEAELAGLTCLEILKKAQNDSRQE